MMFHTACLFLLSACLAGVTVSEKLQKRTEEISTSGPQDVVIAGPDIVTIGIPYGFSCSADGCNPSCLFTMTLDGQTKFSNEFDIIFNRIVTSEVLTCEAKDPETGETASVSKTIQVADGPYNVSIEAPKMLLTGVTSTLVCSVVCYPACTYTWYIGDLNTSPVQASTSNQLNYTTTLYSGQQTIYCWVQNTLTHLFVVSSTIVTVPEGPQNIYINGPSSAVVGETAVFYCFATCIPSCNTIWHYEGKIFNGDEVHLPILTQGKPVIANRLIIDVETYQKNETVTCSAVNTLSGQTESTSVTIRVTDPISVRPITVTPPIAESTYSLECYGAKSGASIQWTKNGKTLSTSDRVYLSDSNVTLTFAPLSASDTGTYQCIVKEQGEVIPGVPYELNVVYGPWDPVVTVSGSTKPVGQITYLLPGTSTTFSCSANCYPTCEYVWYLNGEIKTENSSFTISSANVTDGSELACVPVNRATNNYTDVVTIIEFTGGPNNITISGPNSVQVGVKATFECSAICTPACVYTWDVYGRTLHGSTIDFTISRYVATETLTCTAQNVVTGKLAAANDTLDVTDPDWCGC